MTDEKRAFDMSLDIAASPEDVWRSWTEPTELMRWFPLNADVTPGPGGSIRWAWGEAWAWTMKIEAWEPGTRLRLVQEDYPVYDAEGRALADDRAERASIALEITLESRAGQTRVRLVHSGFGTGADWDDEFDGISTGWQFELRSLRHYLTRHRGRDRQAGWARLSTELPQAAAWARLLGPQGFVVDASERREGAEYSVRTDSGEVYSGSILLAIPGCELAGTAREVGDGVFRVAAYRAAGKTGVTAWLATYGVGTTAAREFEASAQRRLERLFASDGASRVVAHGATA